MQSSNYLNSTTPTNYYCYIHHYILLLNLITLVATRTISCRTGTCFEKMVEKLYLENKSFGYYVRKQILLILNESNQILHIDQETNSINIPFSVHPHYYVQPHRSHRSEKRFPRLHPSYPEEKIP